MRLANWRPRIFVVLFAASFIFFGLGATHLIEYDEAIYGLVAKNILKSGDFLTLQWREGLPWFDKGPLYLWLTAISLKIFGLDSFAVRFWSAGFGVLGCLLIFELGLRLYNRGVGFLAAIILASTSGYLYYARNGMLDVPNATFNSLILLGLWLSLKNPRRLWLVGLSAGLAFLNRGLLAFLSTAAFALFLIFTRRWPYSWRQIITALTAFLGVIFPWHFFESWRHGEFFWDVYLKHQMLLRFASAIEGKVAPLFWYVSVVRTHFRIWFVALLPALPYFIWRFLKKDKSDLLVFLWAGMTFFVFTLAQSKLIWYILPIYPPLALMTARFLEAVARKLRLERVVIFLVIGLATFYNWLNWTRIQPHDFSFDQARLVKEKNQLDARAELLTSGDTFSLSQFYSVGKVLSIPIEEAAANLTDRPDRYAIIARNDYRSLGDEKRFEVSAQSGEKLLIKWIR